VRPAVFDRDVLALNVAGRVEHAIEAPTSVVYGGLRLGERRPPIHWTGDQIGFVLPTCYF
jgi:hypothetical protein